MGQDRRGKSRAPSPARRLAADYLAQAKNIPLVAVSREMDLHELLDLRKHPSISWVAIFAKAYGLAARSNCNLRWNWIKYPFTRIYEHPVTECAVIVERDVAGEQVILAAKIRAPENVSLPELDRHIRRYRDQPVLEVSDFRQLLRLASFPRILRWFTFWSSLHWSGYKRCKRFGTFMISSLGNLGTQTITPIMPLTTYLTFGPISEHGKVTIGIVFDHRVMDGRHAARALTDMESILLSSVAEELRKLADSREMTADTVPPKTYTEN